MGKQVMDHVGLKESQAHGASLTPEELYWRFAPNDIEGNELDAEEIARRIADWSVYFFRQRHIRDGQVPAFHKEIYTDLSQNYRYIVITGPSEFSKTTIVSLLYPLYRNVYYHEPYTVIVSRTDDAARELLDEIKFELRENEEFKRVYGTLIPTSDDKIKDRYKKKDSAHLIELTFSDGTTTAIRSIPMRGQIRSRKRGGYRVTLLIIDDPEEVDDLDSKIILEKNLRWIDRSAIPRMDKDYGKVRVAGTRIGYNCTIDKLLGRKKWVKRNYTALVLPESVEKPTFQQLLKGISIWEKRWPTEWLINEMKEYETEGRLADWMWERMNEPPTYLQKNLKGYLHWRGTFERKNEQNLLWLDGMLDPIVVNTYHAIDPAFSQADSADERAQVTFACGHLPMGEWQKPCIWELEYDFDYKDPDEIIERALDLHKKYFYSNLIVEAIGGAKIYDFLAVKQMARDPFLLAYPLNLNMINYQPKGKEDRIFARFKNYIKLKQLFIHPEHREIQIELDNFLNAPHLHILDALEMGCRYAIPSHEEERHVSPKSRFYKETYENDELYNELKDKGKQYLLW